jgi:RHS repeat-associated protein
MRVGAGESRVRSRCTGKERDSETGLDYFGARYYASNMGRFMSPDWSIKVTPIPYAKLSDPQSLNLYTYVLNNPLSRRDADGHYVELTGDDAARKKQLDALKASVGAKAGAYLYDNTVDGKHYVGVLSGGQDGKGPSFNDINAAANKLGGVIADTNRGASIQFVSPGTSISGVRVGSIDQGMSPAVTTSNSKSAQIYVTSGPVGTMPGNYQSNGRDAVPSLADIISHEFGHVDSSWYHSGLDTNGDAVRMENQTRQSEGEPTRTGHDRPGDVQLGGTQY